MRNLIAAVLLAACTLVLTAPQPAAAQDPYAVIDLVNGLRAELGLPAYRVNAELMAAAQAHSEWAASIGTHSHTGAGGSTPRDRATAAGYGGGAPVRVSENIYWGGRATPANAFEWWSNSAIHYQGMTSTNYLDIGAGIATDADGSGYYTLKFGVIIAEAPPPPTAAPEAGLDAEPALPVDPIALAEPNADGSVIHEVGEGQTVWAIAEAYDVPVSEVLALNRLTEDAIIYPGTELIIVPAPVTVEEEPTGPLFHTVQAGQTPLGIALAYGITLEELFAHNGLTEQSVIYPDDELLIRPGEPTATPPPTATKPPTPTKPAVAQASPPPPTPTDAPVADTPSATRAPGRSPALAVGLVLVGLTGIGLIAGGVLLRE